MCQKPAVFDLEAETLQNTFYREVLYTTDQLQVVLMNVRKGEEIGMEKHPHTTQFLRIEEGEGLAVLGEERKQYKLRPGVAVIVPPNTWHNIIAKTDLKLCSTLFTSLKIKRV